MIVWTDWSKENPNVSIKYRNLNELQDCVVLQSYTKTESNSHTEKWCSTFYQVSKSQWIVVKIYKIVLQS